MFFLSAHLGRTSITVEASDTSLGMSLVFVPKSMRQKESDWVNSESMASAAVNMFLGFIL